MNRRRIEGATVVITGASSGIGRATAELLARKRANLALIARRDDALEEVVRECQALGAQAIAISADVTDADALPRAAHQAAGRFGNRLDVWINNAGVGAVGNFTEIPIAAHDQVIKTNLIGYFHGAYAALPYFQRQQSGVLINVLSLGSWIPSPYAVAYSASKFGLRGFSEALRAELVDYPDIHLCDVFPAFVNTPAFGHCGNYSGKKIRPMPPSYDPYDVGQAIAALVERPRAITTVGQTAVPRVAYALAPQLVRGGMKRLIDRYFAHAKAAPRDDGNLFHGPADPGRVRGSEAPDRPCLIPGNLLAASALAGIAAGVIVLSASKRT